MYKRQKVDKVSLPFVRFKRGDEGFKVSKVKFAGAVSFKRAETVTTGEDGTVSRQFGDMYCSDIRPCLLYTSTGEEAVNGEMTEGEV